MNTETIEEDTGMNEHDFNGFIFLIFVAIFLVVSSIWLILELIRKISGSRMW